MFTYSKCTLTAFLLIASVVVWGGSREVRAQDARARTNPQESSSEAIQDASPAWDPEILQQIPEGELLPDMPEPGTGHSSDVHTPTTSPNYVIGPEDVLEIEVFNVPELKTTTRVSNEGMIALALIGRMNAAGLTTDQLREQLEARYGESYLQDPQISVFVKDFRAQSVSVIGAVEKPGIYQLTAPRNLIEILSMAGGLAKKNTAPAGRTLIVTRKGGFADVPLVDGLSLLADDKVEIEIRKLLYSQETGLNIPIKPFDTISVTKADLVYVVGDVKKPTGIVLEDREDITVLQAVAVAEGINRTASKNKARIFRKTEDGGKIEIPVKLGRILAGKDPDVTLAANDVLFVPDSRGKVLLDRGIQATIATISGVIIWGSR